MILAVSLVLIVRLKNKLGSGLSTYSLSKDNYFVTSSYSTLQRAQIPEYLTGIPSGFTSSKSRTSSTYIYVSSLKKPSLRTGYDLTVLNSRGKSCFLVNLMMTNPFT
ncbi:hypothetical protein [Borrelia miyamotoi]|uniref:hypothetical protein n=1 Tax=Borrelia miyamotoi TaxID=47466 RepID=UPI0031FF025E